MVCLLASFHCQADRFYGQAPIFGGDLDQARRVAIKQILSDASLTGHIDVVAASAQIDQQFKQRTLVSSQSRVRAIRVQSEQIQNDTLSLVVDMELESQAPSSCSPRFPVQHTTLALSDTLSHLPPGEQREKARIFLDRFSVHLSHLSTISRSADEFETLPGYRLEVSIPHDQRIDPNWQFHLSGADGKRITTLSYPLGKETLAKQQTVSLGYANLRKLALTRNGENLSSQIAQDLTSMLRCMPVVIGIPNEFSGDTIQVNAIEKRPTDKTPAFALFAERFPVGVDGRIDLLRIDGVLDVRNGADGALILQKSRTKGTPGLPPGGFIVLQ